MSITDKLLRRLPEPDYEPIRTALMLALTEGKWMNAAEIMSNASTYIGGEYRPALRVVFKTLGTLADEGLVEVGTTSELMKRWRLTAYGKDELEQMGADNV